MLKVWSPVLQHEEMREPLRDGDNDKVARLFLEAQLKGTGNPNFLNPGLEVSNALLHLFLSCWCAFL